MNYFDNHFFGPCGSSPFFQGHTHNTPIYYGVQYNHRGKFFLQVDHGEYFKMEGAYVFITHPDAFFEYGNPSKESRHHVFICSYGERIQSYIDSGLLPINDKKPLIAIANPERFLRTMLKITDLVTEFAPVVPPRAILLYEDLLLQLHESKRSEPEIGAFHHERFAQLASDVRKNPERNWNFSHLASKFGMTDTHFRRLFKLQTGFPPCQFLIQCRLQLAAKLLVENGDTVNSIAYQVGIENEFYFSRLFRSKFQSSPTEYRKQFLR